VKYFIILSTLVLIVCTPSVPPQVLDALWTKTIGGSKSDAGQSVQQTKDGGYIIIGYTYSFGERIWLLKTDEHGDTVWTKTFGSGGGDNGLSIQQTSDDGYIVTGQIWSLCAGVCLIKTDKNGDSLWTKTVGGIGPSVGRSVQQTSDKGFIVTGEVLEDVVLIKTDENGDSLWTKIYGGNELDVGNSIHQTNDGGYIIVGTTYSFGIGEDDIWLIKTDENGDTLWTKTYGGNSGEEGYSVQQTNDGGYIIVGYTDSFGAGKDDIWLIKTDAIGDTLWTRTFGGGNDEEGYSVWQTEDGGYIITGYTNSFGEGDDDVWIIKTNRDGDTLWTKTLGGVESDVGNSVQQTAEGGYVVTGYTNSFGNGDSDVWLIKLEAD